MAEMRYLPRTRALLGAHGTTFDDYFVSNSLCCPSRTTTLRGQYAHNTGVWSNGGDNGGFERAYANGIEQDTVATRLHGVGYTTSLTGKYLNGYPNGAPPDYVPPGWDNWASAVYGNPYSEYHYVLNQNQTYHVYRHRPRDYGTDVYIRLTDRFIRGAAHDHQPFFAYLPVYAPHQPATPAPADIAKFPARAGTADAQLRPDRREPHASLRARPAPVHHGRDAVRSTASTACASGRCKPSTGAWRASYARCGPPSSSTTPTSCSHRTTASTSASTACRQGKQTAYEPDIHVPLLVRGPGVRSGAHVTQLAGNTDLAPTFEAMAGARGHRRSPTGGRSCRSSRGAHPSPWRTAYLIEHRVEAGVSQPARAPAKNSTLEPSDPDEAIARPAPAPGDPRHDAPEPRRRDPRLRRPPHRPGALRGVRQRRPRAVRPAHRPRRDRATWRAPNRGWNGRWPTGSRSCAAAPGAAVVWRRTVRSATHRVGRPEAVLLRCAASGEAEPPSSSGPGRRPFKAVTGIRTPLGAPSAPHATLVAPAHRVLWCSLECTPPCQGGGRGFKSRQDRGRPSLRRRSSRGRVAQSAEHAPEKRGVTGSTPVPATTKALVTALRWARASSCGRRRATHVPHRATFFAVSPLVA